MGIKIKFPKIKFPRNRLLEWWIPRVAWSALISHIISSLVFAGLIRILLWILSVSIPAPYGELGLDIILLCISFVFSVFLTSIALWPHLNVLIKGISKISPFPAKLLISNFFHEELSLISSTIGELTEKGKLMTRPEVLQWVSRCFQTFKGRYIGIDGSLPSEFTRRYIGYLDAHQSYIEKTKISNSKRILLNTPSRILNDITVHGKSSSDFIDWHLKDNKVGLNYYDKEEALEIARKYDIKLNGDIITDIALWEGEAAILFSVVEHEKVDSEKFRLRMALRGTNIYDSCKKYVDEIEALSLPLKPEELHVMPPSLVEKWELFTDPSKRLPSIIPFLEARVKEVSNNSKTPLKDMRLLDAGAGMGIEAVKLVSKGFKVILNEIDPVFTNKSREYARASNVIVPEESYTSWNWFRFSDAFGTETYHIIWVLGNSLCLLYDNDEVTTVLIEFYKVLSNGGALIIDERNFQYIIDNWDHIKSDPWKRYPYKCKVIYCGEKVKGVPVELIKTGRVVFEYKSLQETPPRVLARISLLAFKDGELKKLLLKSGFTKVDVYKDLIKEEDYKNNQPDFLTYVAWK